MFLPSTGGRIRNLVTIAPPETNREQLNLALVVVAHKDLGGVAYAVIPANGPLPVVLSEDFRLRVVVAAGGEFGSAFAAGYSLARASIFGSIQAPLAGPVHGLIWVPPNFVIAALVSCPGSLAGARLSVAFFSYLFRREITGELTGSRHCRPEQPCVQRLLVVLKAGKEEELVVVLVESRSWNDDRAADGAPGIVVGVAPAVSRCCCCSTSHSS